MNRRKFIQIAGASAGATMLASNASSAEPTKPAPAPALKKVGNGKIKLALYSISYGGTYYQGDALPFDEVCRRAKDYGYEGVELDNKRPYGNPMDISPKQRDQMRATLANLGLEIPCIAANNDYSSPIPELRECNLLMVRETARLAKDLGAKIVRVHAAWPGVPIHNGMGTYEFNPYPKAGADDFYTFKRDYPYSTWVERRGFVKQCLIETARMGEEFGVVMALQNHRPVIRCWKDTYDLVQEINSPWLKICLDLPIMEKLEDKNYVENAIRTCGNLTVWSHFGGEYFRTPTGEVKAMSYRLFDEILPDYRHFLGVLGDIGYEGWFAFELCHPLWKPGFEPQGVDFAHDQVKLAREFIGNML